MLQPKTAGSSWAAPREKRAPIASITLAKTKSFGRYKQPFLHFDLNLEQQACMPFPGRSDLDNDPFWKKFCTQERSVLTQ